MQTISLFDVEDFVLDLDNAPVVAAMEEAGVFDEFVPAEDGVVEPVVESRPRYHERDAIAAAAMRPNTVIVNRIGNKAVSVTAADSFSALVLMEFKLSGVGAVRPDLPPKAFDPAAWNGMPRFDADGKELKDLVAKPEKQEKYTYSRVRVYFDIKDTIAPSFRESSVYRFLESIGVNIAVAPSFEGWVPKAYRRQVLNSTPFQLSEITDTRPLYERLEEGYRVKCIQSVGTFLANCEYVVGEKTPANDDSGEDGFVNLHQCGRRGSYSTGIRWSDTVEMEPFFENAQVQEVIYNPALCVPQVYKTAFDANMARIQSEKWEVFDHTAFDVSQAAVKQCYFNGKPMRMGKSRESIAFHKLRNNKRIAFFCTKNMSVIALREAAALGITDCQVIDSHKALNAVEKQAWMEVVPYGWMKYRKDPMAVKNAVPIVERKNCPHCDQVLERRHFECAEPTDEIPNPVGGWVWTSSFGYLCRNRNCSYTQSLIDTTKPGRKPKRRGGAVWFEEAKEDSIIHSFTTPFALSFADGEPVTRSVMSGYVDLDRKAHVKHMFTPTGKPSDSASFKGRRCLTCGYIAQEWTPAPYRRLKNRYDGIILDEIHGCQSGTSNITAAVLALHAPSIVGLTGTLMPNDPSDAFWPLFRMFGNNTFEFPYAKTQAAPYQGVTKFNADFTETLTVVNTDRESSYKKHIPYLKNPIKFWKFMSPKMIRRTYDDPLVVQSLQKAGLKVPKSEVKLIIVPPDPKQAALMLASMQEFDTQFQEYRRSLQQRGTEDRTYLLNSAYVISRMTRLRMGATCPDYINEKLAVQKLPPLYVGARGGAKMEHVYNVCLNKVAKGEKVLVLSDFKCMQRIMAEELSIFRPIVFNTSWSKTKRQEAFDLFNDDPDYKVFIAGPRAIGLGVDLAGGPDSLCRTVVSTDLLWRPGEQQQAWARIMKPAKSDYAVEVYVLVLDASIDKHVYNTFYSKLFAAEQALDRKVVTQKVKPFDVGAFVDQVLADRDQMLEFLQRSGEDEMSYMPYVEMFSMEDREI